VLYDRVATGADLYRAGKVAKLLMSGDNSQVDYNEVGVMRQTALDLGVPSADIVLDYAGFRTYDSCYRARDVFGLRAVTLVTNRFHLPRALYTCRELGLDVVGVDADRRAYQGTPYWTLREAVALPVAWWWTHIDRQPTFLGPAVDVDHPPVQP
jgi:SanA protein